MKKKGFTLVELLAVIIVLGTILTITVSITNKSLEESKKDIYISSVTNLSKALSEYYIEENILSDFKECYYDFNNDETTCENFKFTGEKPDCGIIKIDSKGNINGAVNYKDNIITVYNGKVEPIKKGSCDTHHYVDTTNDYRNIELIENKKLDGIYTITNEGKLLNKTGEIEIQTTKKPNDGFLSYTNNTLENGCITLDENKIIIEDGKITKIEKGQCPNPKCIKATKLHQEECTQTDPNYYCSGAGYTLTGSKKTNIITYGNITKKGTEPKSGDAYDCDVNGDNIYDQETERFYYVSDLYNTKTKKFDSTYAVLIYYNNIIIDNDGKVVPNNTTNSRKAYYTSPTTPSISENWHGPLTAINNLPTINDWSNVRLSSNVRTIVNDKGEGTTDNGAKLLPTEFNYQKNEIPLAARLITTQEIEKSVNKKTSSTSHGYLDEHTFLVENTVFSTGALRGYWVETPKKDRNDITRLITGKGRSISNDYSRNMVSLGVRPVIEILKKDLY